MGRGIRPLAIKLSKQRLSKARIEASAVPIVLEGMDTLTMPDKFKGDTVAKKVWTDTYKKLKMIEQVKIHDENVLSRYAEQCSVYDRQMAVFHNTEADYDVRQKAQQHALSTARVLATLEDNLFLNPKSRRNGALPQTQKEASEIKRRLENAGLGDFK